MKNEIVYKKWNWNDDDFCRDTSTDWIDITIEKMHGGIGRLIYETHWLTEHLIVWQARYGGIFNKNNPKFTRENIESCESIQDIRNSTLGNLVKLMVNRLNFEKDDECLHHILLDRNFFVHTFYGKFIATPEDRENYFLNKNCKRLKIAINTVIKFNNRILPLIQKDLNRVG